MEGKFRVWCKNKEQWEVDYCVLTSEGVLLHRVRSLWVPLDPSTHIVQFYTGEDIPDIGEMIYDGDIIEQSYISKLNEKKVVKKYLIVFEDAYYKAKLIGHSPYGDTLLHFVLANSDLFDTKIIGSKFESPELLEGADD